MRFAPLPRSLFGRLVLLLTVLLGAAQLLSAAAHFYDRNQFMVHTAGINSAERIAGIVRLLDPMSRSERARAVRALDVPPMRVALGSIGIGGRTAAGDAARAMKRVLAKELPGHPLAVVTWQPSMPETVPDMPRQAPPWASAMHRRMTELMAPRMARASYLIEIGLGDGQVVSFDYHLPADLFAWRWRLVASLLILLASAVLIAWIAVRWMTRPLAVLAEAADELGRDIQRPPLPENGPAEVATAARAFNRMQRRLARFIDDRARVLAAVSHDLKTPITRMRLRTDLLNDSTLQAKYEKDLAEMEGMVADTLDFLRDMESGEPVQPVDVEALLESIQSDSEAIGRTLALRGRSLGPLRARPRALKRCIDNLVHNALRHGSHAAITIDDSPRELKLYIRDDGPGIPEEQLERVFEPFHRIEVSRSRETGGSGLGLSIARNIARSHGGDVTLRNHTQGGLEAIVTLPR